MQGALALGVGVAAATHMAAKAQAAPNKGGHLRVGKAHGQTTDSLDPVSWENGFMLQMGYACQDFLTEIDNTGQLVPRLAESWEASDDAVSWTFKIKQGAEFHDGRRHRLD
jgi:peptide/nickel transport system substrate-binding protein